MLMALGILMVAFAREAAAQAPVPAAPPGQAPSPAASAWDVRLGAGLAYQPDYEGSDDYELKPLPLLTIAYRDIVFLRGTTLGANLYTVKGPRPEDRLQLGILARYRFGRDQDDNSALRGLGDVDGAVELGASARLRSGGWSVGLGVAQDVADGHDGALAEIEAGYGFAIAPKLRGSLEVSATWADEAYMQTYFGISPRQSARSGYARFDASGGVKDAGLSVGLDYAVLEQWSISGRARYKRLLGDAADSPIVAERGSENQFALTVFLGYRF